MNSRLCWSQRVVQHIVPPRYRGHEYEIVAIDGLTDVRDTGLLAAWAWFKSMLGFKTKIPAA